MELTPELKKEILDSYVRGLELEPAKLTREELEMEIINYLCIVRLAEPTK